jgi:hypothetical protein
MLGNYRVAAQLVASRVVLSSTELVMQETIIRLLMIWAGNRIVSNWFLNRCISMDSIYLVQDKVQELA